MSATPDDVPASWSQIQELYFYHLLNLHRNKITAINILNVNVRQVD